MKNYKITYINGAGVTETVDVVADTIREAYSTFFDEFGIVPSEVSPK